MDDSLPSDLKALLHARGLAWVRTLVSSERKQQHTGLVRGADGTQMVLKYRDPSKGVPLTEAAFYSRHRKPYLPRTLEVGRDHLIMVYHEGCRLRELLSRASLDRASREALIEALLQAPIGDRPVRVSDVREAMLRSLRRLMRSGPMDVPEDQAPRLALSRSASRILSLIVRPMLWIRAAEAAQAGPAVYQHGDLHLNNVLVSPTDGIILVDWEDAFVGTPVCDWLYFWPQYLCLAGPDATFERFRSGAAELWPSQLRVFDRLLPLYSWAAKTNPRFCPSGDGGRGPKDG